MQNLWKNEIEMRKIQIATSDKAKIFHWQLVKL